MMKYGLIIPDGAADERLPNLGDRTPLEAAETPNLDRLAAVGRLGLVHTTPAGFAAGSDVCSMSLLGYDPARFHTGRAPIEAAALGVAGGPDDAVYRVNLVTIEAGSIMRDHSAGGIGGEEARELFEAIGRAWDEAGLLDGAQLVPGEGYRAALVDRTGRGFEGLVTHPPHEMLDDPIGGRGPSGGPAALWLIALTEHARRVLQAHEVNRRRIERGVRPATDVWIWGQGGFPTAPPFVERFGRRGAMTTAVDLLAGLAALIGWDRLAVPGLTGWHDTDYRAQGEASAQALDRYDIVCCHVETPDEAAHQGDWSTKVAAIEAIDHWCVGPMVERLMRESAWRVLVLPDHYTLCRTRKHDATPPPFLVAGTGVAPGGGSRFTEQEASASGWTIARGHELLQRTLFDAG
ncbi:MAG: 2,3-bisphosphoglycerate-independent phosphoglycerate mutase [Phycisphaerales bacterium]